MQKDLQNISKYYHSYLSFSIVYYIFYLWTAPEINKFAPLKLSLHMNLKAEGHLGPHNSAATKVILQIIKLKFAEQKIFSPYVPF